MLRIELDASRSWTAEKCVDSCAVSPKDFAVVHFAIQQNSSPAIYIHTCLGFVLVARYSASYHVADGLSFQIKTQRRGGCSVCNVLTSTGFFLATTR